MTPPNKASKRAKRAPRNAQEGRRSLSNGPRAFKDAQEGLKTAPQALETPQESSKWSPQEGSKKHKSLIYHWFLKDSSLLAFSASRRSKTAQEPPKSAPRRPKCGFVSKDDNLGRVIECAVFL